MIKGNRSNKGSPQLVVHEHDPLKRILFWALLAVVFIATGYLLYDYGHSRADYDFESLETERDELQQQLASLRAEADSLSNELVAEQQRAEIEKQAYAEVDNSLQDLQSEILELKEEVAFYRSIVAPRESARGLRIQRFVVEPTGPDRTYRYKLVLTQVIKGNRRVARGKVTMQLEGLRDGKPQQFNLTSLSATGQKYLDFRFRYFQSFEGDFLLPEGFVPSRVHVKVASSKVSLEESFAWPQQNVSRSGSLKVSLR